MAFSVTEKITTNGFNVISGSLHIVFPLSSGQYVPLHNFIKMYKLSKMYTREGESKFQSQKKVKQKTNRIPISIQVTQKKFAKFLGMRNQSHLWASEGGIPVCAVVVMLTWVKVVLLTPKYWASQYLSLTCTTSSQTSTGHHPALWSHLLP